MFTNKKIALVSVINDLSADVRVKKTADTLLEMGFSVHLIGRLLPQSKPLQMPGIKTTRMRLIFKKGPLFYLFFNLRLFFQLLFRKADLLYANDLDTLLPNYLVSKMKGIPLIYDSHELFCEVPELMHSPLKKRIWLSLEGWIVPKLQYLITVSDGIAAYFENKYQTKFTVVRNIPPPMPENFVIKNRATLGLPTDKKIILLQGAGINIDRGAEELMDAMPLIENAVLYIIGSGDVWPVLQQKRAQQHLENKVVLLEKLPKQELMQYTANADLGLSLDKNTNLNYYYSLPNKLFDYIACGAPVLASRLSEIEKIVTTYRIGEFIESHNPEHIAARINDMLQSNHLAEYKHNTTAANAALNWTNEKQKLMALITSASVG